MFAVKKVAGTNGLFLEDGYFLEGEVVIELDGIVRPSPTQTSIKIAENQHIEDLYGQFVNHNCNPTVVVDGRKLVAARDLGPGDQITFSYPDNEDALVVPFTCFCCGKKIK